MSILVIGGAGYIGSHMVLRLIEEGHHPIILDNLSEGHRDAILGGTFIKGDIGDRALLLSIFREHQIDVVMHFAAYCYVGESVTDPSKYYLNNVVKTHTLLDAMRECRIRNFIFSSTCATYGVPITLPFKENHPQNPINPYGKTKLMVEQMVADFEKAYGLRSMIFRYFNAAGAEPEARIGEAHNTETHLIPLVMEAAKGELSHVTIFGDDYDTPDGTCIRDYIHVLDIADAHLLGMNALLEGKPSATYNLANGQGFSVKEVISAVEKVSGKTVTKKVAARRAGDPARLIGDSSKVRRELGWDPQYPDIMQIIETAWKWKKHLKK